MKIKREDILASITDEAEKKAVGTLLDYAEQLAKEAQMTEEKVKSLLDEKAKELEIESEKVKGFTELAQAVKTLQENAKSNVKESELAIAVKKLSAEAIKEVKGLNTEKFVEVEVSAKTAPTTMTTANVDVTSIPYIPAVEVQQGVIADVKPVQTIMSLVSVQTISKPFLAWTERKAPNGNATWIGEGTIKALQDYTWENYTETTKKIASRTKFSEEAIDDIDFMQNEIYTLQGRDLERQMSSAVLSATKSSTSIGGITTMASAYTITALNGTVNDVNLYDVCNAMNAQCVALGFTGRKTLVVNTYDWAEAKSQKDGMKRPLDIVEKIMSEYIVVEDPEMPQGSILFGELSYFVVKMYKKKGIRLGYSSEDWEKNLMSAIAENRLLTMLPDNHKGAIIFDTVANVKAAIGVVTA